MKLRTKVRASAFSLLIALLGGASQAADLRLHVIPLSNDDGKTQAASISPTQFTDLVKQINTAFQGTVIRFIFDPSTDWVPMANTPYGPKMQTCSRSP